MTLQNLLSIGRLKAHVATALEIKRLLAVLDALRRKRNSNDYTGDVVTAGMVAECIVQAKSLLEILKKYLRKNHPKLLRG